MIKHNDRYIKEVLNEMIKSNPRMERGYNTVRLQEVWKSVMGEMINNYTDKLYFKKGVLYVQLTSAPLRQEMDMSKHKAIKLLNDSLSEDLITDIVFR